MVITNCKFCGKQYKKNGKNPKTSFCSVPCKANWQREYNVGSNHPRWKESYVRVKTCKYCKKEFTNPNPTTFQNMKFCSKKCADIGGFRYSGENHPNWTGRKSELKRLRSLPKYTRWSKAVLERDNYTCQLCNKRGGDLHAHHIKSFLEYPDYRFDVGNGLTLCVQCHRNLHSLNKRLIENGVNSVELLKRTIPSRA
jgi:endogenous inhibitor of DNA gyrase (YacG/DUF329 family)